MMAQRNGTVNATVTSSTRVESTGVTPEILAFLVLPAVFAVKLVGALDARFGSTRVTGYFYDFLRQLPVIAGIKIQRGVVRHVCRHRVQPGHDDGTLEGHV